MAKKVKGRCVKTLFDRQILCAGTMLDYIEILGRRITTTSFTQLQTTEQFTSIIKCFGYLEAINFTNRFGGINIDNTVTHLAYVPFEQEIYELDVNTLFVTKEATRPRLFKLMKIQNFSEQDEYLIFQLKETGFRDLEASEG